jgi:hypothetical protein
MASNISYCHFNEGQDEACEGACVEGQMHLSDRKAALQSLIITAEVIPNPEVKSVTHTEAQTQSVTVSPQLLARLPFISNSRLYKRKYIHL